MRWWLGIMAVVVAASAAQAGPITRPLAESSG
jgi:hypothetical protein